MAGLGLLTKKECDFPPGGSRQRCQRGKLEGRGRRDLKRCCYRIAAATSLAHGGHALCEGKLGRRSGWRMDVLCLNQMSSVLPQSCTSLLPQRMALRASSGQHRQTQVTMAHPAGMHRSSQVHSDLRTLLLALLQTDANRTRCGCHVGDSTYFTCCKIR